MKIAAIIACLFLTIGLSAQTVEDKAVFNRYMETMRSKRQLSTDKLMVEAARFFLGAPYVAGTLEEEPERLVVNLRELDCMTLVETTTALVRTLRTENPSYETFCLNLQEARYRDGSIGDYTDRLHYTTDWMYENQRKGRLKDVTGEIGGKPLDLQLSFMSTHPDSYKQMKGNPRRVAVMAAKEKEISARTHFYIPQDEINAHAGKIRNGDIVCFVTTVKGLDISHVGIICREGETLTFIHASTSKKKVIVNEGPLQEYVQRIKRNSGIMIVRPQF